MKFGSNNNNIQIWNEKRVQTTNGEPKAQKWWRKGKLRRLGWRRQFSTENMFFDTISLSPFINIPFSTQFRLFLL